MNRIEAFWQTLFKKVLDCIFRSPEFFASDTQKIEAYCFCYEGGLSLRCKGLPCVGFKEKEG